MIEYHLHKSYGQYPILIVQYGIGGRGVWCYVQCLGTMGTVSCLVLW